MRDSSSRSSAVGPCPSEELRPGFKRIAFEKHYELAVGVQPKYRVCLGGWTSMAAILGALLLTTTPTLAADNFAVNNATGTFTVIRCTDTAGVCTLNVITTPSGSSTSEKVNIDQTTPGTTNGVTIAPTSGTAAGITSVVSGSAENNHVLKAGAGALYSAYATNLTGTAGFLAILNTTSSPGDGAITPLDCAPLPANGNAAINYRPGPTKIYTTGITAVVTSATTCFTKTTGVITAFISGDVQ